MTDCGTDRHKGGFVGGVNTPGPPPVYLEDPPISPEEVYPLDLEHTLPSEPAGDGVPPLLPTGELC